jgi:hypothetical protein
MLVGIVIIIFLIALIATVSVGIKPAERNYAGTTKNRLVRLTLIYIAGTIVFLGLLYFLKI